MRVRKITIVCLAFVFSFLSAPAYAASGSLMVSSFLANDPEIEKQWYLEKIKAIDAWDIGQGSNNVVVAVIDSGIDMKHPDLRDNVWVNQDEILGDGTDNDGNGYIDDINGWDFVEEDNEPEPNPDKEHSIVAVHHGTAVAGIIGAAGNNGFAGAGISWRVKIMDLKAFNEKGESDTDTVSRALDYAIAKHADIINMSFVGLGYSESLDAKIKKAYSRGILIVAAAGNENGGAQGHSMNNQKAYPVCFGDGGDANYVVGVAGVDREDKKTDFSNYGSACIDISAPARSIYSTFYQNDKYPDFQYYFGGAFNGTSMAVPQVAGAAALIKAAHPGYTAKELTKVLLDSADKIDSANPEFIGQLGRGRLNVFKALQMPVIPTEPSDEASVKYILSAPAGYEPRIWLLDNLGNVVRNFLALAPGFRGGLNISSGDIDSDGRMEIIVGAGAGGGPHIRIFDLKGVLKNQFFALDKSYRGGAITAVGLDAEGKNRIFIFGRSDGAPAVGIYDSDGGLLKTIAFSGKIKTISAFAIGDVNRDGVAEMIFSEKGRIKVFDINGGLLSDFVAIGKYAGNVNLAVGDLNADGWFEILVSKKSGDGLIYTYNYKGKQLSPIFRAYRGTSAANISSGDRNSDGRYEVIVAPAGKISAELKILDGDFGLKMALYPFGKKFTKPLNAYIITRK
jgi:subtilisin family serine protease